MVVCFHKSTFFISSGAKRFFGLRILGVSLTAQQPPFLAMVGSQQEIRLCSRVFTSGFSGRLANDNRKFRENSPFTKSLKVKRVGKFQ